jgi:hypothetical protein
MPFEQAAIFFFKRRGSGRKHFVIISDAPYEHRNIISKETNDHIAVWEGEKQRTRISRYWNKDSVLAARF